MANLRAIRTRIKSVENTRQITKSMKMVAAAKLRKTQDAFANLRAYADRSGDILKEIAAESENLWLKPRAEIRTICYVLVVGNRGLCGTYNQALLRYCENLVKSSDKANYVISCGRWGKDLIASAGLEVQETFEISDTPEHGEALQVAERLKSLYREGTVDEIVLVYQHYRTVLAQEPTQTVLLPIRETGNGSPPSSPPKGAAASQEKMSAPEPPEIIFVPDRESLVSTLLDMYIGNTVHAVLLEARVGEHSARMTAMTAAADNTEELIGELTLELNHARQTAITTEISEIAGGAEALRNSKKDEDA